MIQVSYTPTVNPSFSRLSHRLKQINLLYPDALSLMRSIGYAVTNLCIRVTRVCNLRCPFCLSSTTQADHECMSAEDFIKVVDFFYACGLRAVAISGGDPLLYPPLKLLLHHFHNLRLSVSITTNGTIDIGEFLDITRHIGVRVKVSLHGLPPIHNKIQPAAPYSQVIGTVQQVLLAGTPLTINTMLCKQNGSPEFLGEFISELISMRVPRVRFIRYARRRYDADHESYELTENDFHRLKFWLIKARTVWENRIEIRCSDYFSHPYIVLEPSGLLVLEHGDCRQDRLLHHFKGTQA